MSGVAVYLENRPRHPCLQGLQRMACVRLSSGREVMTEQDFARWWEEQHDDRERGTSFCDALRREVAKRLPLRNFRRLSLAIGHRLLGQDSLWSDAEPIVAVVRPFVPAGEGKGDAFPCPELFQSARQGEVEGVVRLLEEPRDPDVEYQCKKRKIAEAFETGQWQKVMLLDEATGRMPVHCASIHGTRREVLGGSRC